MLSQAMVQALERLSRSLSGAGNGWLVGGSCGLMLQRIPLEKPPRDLDIYVDGELVVPIAEALSPYALDEPHFSETGMYRSCLSHYKMDGVVIELVGDFQVHSQSSIYRVRVADLLLKYAPRVTVAGTEIRLTPLAHELVFNLLRNRPDRYESIAREMRRRRSSHLPVLSDIVSGNPFSAAVVEQLRQLLQIPAEEGNEPGATRHPFSSRQ